MQVESFTAQAKGKLWKAHQMSCPPCTRFDRKIGTCNWGRVTRCNGTGTHTVQLGRRIRRLRDRA